jgi:toxin HigB-1
LIRLYSLQESINTTSSSGQLDSVDVLRVAVRKLDQVDSVTTIDELAVPPGNHLEKLTGDQESQYSIRINDQYRICFEWSESDAEEVEIVDYH